MRRFAVRFALLLLSASLAHGQNFSTAPCQGNESSSSSWFFSHNEQACEVRSAVLPLVNDQIKVSGKNGAIEILGEDRRDIALEVRISAQGSSHEDAIARLHQIRIVTGADIHAEGPSESGSHHGWEVNFKLHVPRHLAANLHTMNGGIAVAGIDGAVTADTMNGALALHGLAGDVHAQTVNGGIDVTLAGDRWQGHGLYAKTTNGGVSVRVPDHFAAHLIASTVNGGIEVGFPITVQGRIRNAIDTEINGGGSTVQLETTNGGISIDRL